MCTKSKVPGKNQGKLDIYLCAKRDFGVSLCASAPRWCGLINEYLEIPSSLFSSTSPPPCHLLVGYLYWTVGVRSIVSIRYTHFPPFDLTRRGEFPVPREELTGTGFYLGWSSIALGNIV